MADHVFKKTGGSDHKVPGKEMPRGGGRGGDRELRLGGDKGGVLMHGRAGEHKVPGKEMKGRSHS